MLCVNYTLALIAKTTQRKKFTGVPGTPETCVGTFDNLVRCPDGLPPQRQDRPPPPEISFGSLTFEVGVPRGSGSKVNLFPCDWCKLSAV